MSQNILPDDLPAKKVHVWVALALVAFITIFLWWLDLKIIDEIGREIDRNPQGESNWSRQLSIGRAVLENLIAGAWGALFLALIFRSIISFIDPRERVIEISPSSIGKRLKSNAQSTTMYSFIGNTATYVSSSILPILVESARRTRSIRTANLYIIDPMDSMSVKCYSDFKNEVARSRITVASSEIAGWIRPTSTLILETEENVVSKLLAAIYLSAYASVQSHMKLKVNLRRSFNPFRADISDSEVILTQESSDEPAVAFAKRGEFYKWYHKEAAAQYTQTTTLDFHSSRTELLNMDLAHPTEGEMRIKSSLISLIQHFTHLASLQTKPQIIDDAVKRIITPQHSY